jgi:hypothetical protein
MSEIFLNDRATILWRRLDLPGHDSAALVRTPDGWHLSGVAVLAESDRPCRIEYEIDCDSRWLTRRCTLAGYIGATIVSLDLARTSAGEWTVDGAPAANLRGCDDIDLGFTPATNLLPIRRLELPTGGKAAVRAAWVRFPELTIEVLDQVYTRLAEDRYLYESAGGSFRRKLSVDDIGFVVDYPDFWRAQANS